MPMTGAEMREVRQRTGLTQAALAEQLGLSRKTVNEAEALNHGFVDKRTELAVRALTQTASARAELTEEAQRCREAGDIDEAGLLDYAATLLNGGFASDTRTIYNLARTAATLRREATRLQEAMRSGPP
jgi:transcriptional regulator with XRE-family HTH domain